MNESKTKSSHMRFSIRFVVTKGFRNYKLRLTGHGTVTDVAIVLGIMVVVGVVVAIIFRAF
jgi:hypothetical protein